MNNSCNKYDVKIIRKVEDLESIKTIWNEIIKNNNNVHLTYEWINCWLKCFLDRYSSLYIIIIKNDNQAVALVPLLIKKDKLLFFHYRKVEFISMTDYPDSPLNICSELDFIITQVENGIIETIISELMKENWNFVRLNPIPLESTTLSGLKNAATKHNLIYFEREAFKSLIINTAVELDLFHKQISKGFRKELRHHQNRIKELGELNFVLLKSKEEISDNLKNVLDIEQKSWKWNKGISINSVRYNNFFQEFPLSVSHLGWIHLWFLKLNDKYIAYDYNICYKDKVICMKGSYDKNYSDYGPGQILLSKEIEYYINNGITEFNLLWGSTKAKERWKPIKKTYMEVFIFRKNIYSVILKALLLDLKFYMLLRILKDYKNRILRKLKIRTSKSELTRMDQLKKK